MQILQGIDCYSEKVITDQKQLELVNVNKVKMEINV